MIGTVRDIMVQVPSPRAVFVDHPVGRTFGRPGAADQHEIVLRDALSELPRFTESGQIRDLPNQWEADGNRSWEAMVHEMLPPRPPRS